MLPLPLLLLLVTLPPALSAAPGHVIATNSFETPAVTGRTPRSAGGDPSQATPGPGASPFWQSIEDHPNLGECGSITAGLTNRSAHSGAQSLFIEAINLHAPYLGVQWSSRPIPIKPHQYYRITLWGCSIPAPAQPDRPFSNTPQPSKKEHNLPAPLYLTIQVCFHGKPDNREPSAPLYLVRPLQNLAGTRIGLDPGKWTPLGFTFEAPAKAQTLCVTFRCDTRASQGAANATLYFDDFTLSEEFPISPDATLARRFPQKPRQRIRTNRSQKHFICLP